MNGKKHGKGKYYYEFGKLLFKGEYLNGLKWNGKIYDPNGIITLIFENGNGKGKTYHKSGTLKYEGEFIKGKLNGKVKKYDSANDKDLVFEGEYFNGKRNGKGKEYKYSIFEGEYLDDKRYGKGKQYSYYHSRYSSSDGIRMEFEGEFLYGKKMDMEKNIVTKVY